MVGKQGRGKQGRKGLRDDLDVISVQGSSYNAPEVMGILTAKGITFRIIDQRGGDLKIVLTGNRAEAQRALELLKEKSLQAIEKNPVSRAKLFTFLKSKYGLPPNMLQSLRGTMFLIAESAKLLLTPLQRRHYFLHLSNDVFPRNLFTPEVQKMLSVA